MGFDNLVGEKEDSNENKYKNQGGSNKSKYVRITQDEMEEYFNSITNHWYDVDVEVDFEDSNKKFTGEIVYEFPTLIDHDDLVGRLYSTIEKSTGKAREKGEDAIRLVIWSNNANRPVGGRKRTHRIKTWRKNLTDKFISIRDEWDQYVESCKKCRGWLVERKNNKTGDKFLGCINYPDCKYTDQMDD